MSAWATPRGISGLKVLKQSPVFIGAISDRFELIRPELKKQGANQSDVIKNRLTPPVRD